MEMVQFSPNLSHFYPVFPEFLLPLFLVFSQICFSVLHISIFFILFQGGTVYQFIQETVSVDDFLRLREISGLSPRSYQAALLGLPNSLYGVQVRIRQQTIGMARVVGDGGLNFEIVDVAVDPAYQRQGGGTQLMAYVMNYLTEHASEGAYITLMADAPALYEKFGFRLSRPRSEGMYLIQPKKK